MGQQVQTQVGVERVRGLVVERGDRRANQHGLDVAVLVAAGQRGQFLGDLGHRQPGRAGGDDSRVASLLPFVPVASELRLGEPRVENRSVGGDGGHADA